MAGRIEVPLAQVIGSDGVAEMKPRHTNKRPDCFSPGLLLLPLVTSQGDNQGLENLHCAVAQRTWGSRARRGRGMKGC